MKKMILLFLILLSNFLFAQEYDIDYFSYVLSKKYNKTVILDKEVVKFLKVYGDKINEIDLSLLNLILKNNGYKLYTVKDFIYIQNSIIQDETNKRQRPENLIKSSVLDIPLPPEKVKTICSSLDVQCVYLNDASYFVSYDATKDISVLTQLKRQNKSSIKGGRIQLQIYSFDRSRLEKYNVDFNVLFQYVLNNSAFPVKFLTSFNVPAPSDYFIDLSALFEMFEDKNIVDVLTTVSFPIINGNHIKYSLGSTQSVQSGAITNPENNTIQQQYETVNTGFNIDFTTDFVSSQIFINLTITDSGEVVMNNDGTYTIPNSKTFSSKLYFDSDNTTYYIPFVKSVKTQNNRTYKILPSFLDSDNSSTSSKMIIIKLTYLPPFKI